MEDTNSNLQANIFILKFCTAIVSKGFVPLLVKNKFEWKLILRNWQWIGIWDGAISVCAAIPIPKWVILVLGCMLEDTNSSYQVNILKLDLCSLCLIVELRKSNFLNFWRWTCLNLERVIGKEWAFQTLQQMQSMQIQFLNERPFDLHILEHTDLNFQANMFKLLVCI